MILRTCGSVLVERQFYRDAANGPLLSQGRHQERRFRHASSVGVYPQVAAPEGPLLCRQRAAAHGEMGEHQRVATNEEAKKYRVAEPVGTLKKLSEGKILCLRRHGDGKTVPLVTNNLERRGRRVVGADLPRWSIELLIKKEKQHQAPGDCRVLRCPAGSSHLHLVERDYVGLTHRTWTRSVQQGETECRNLLRLPPLQQLKAQLGRAVWNDAVNYVVKVSYERRVIRRREQRPAT